MFQHIDSKSVCVDAYLFTLDALTQNVFFQFQSFLQQLMKLAVEQEKRSKIQEKERVKENAADAVADQIRADEEAEEAQPKKKKKQNKKKSKK